MERYCCEDNRKRRRVLRVTCNIIFKDFLGTGAGIRGRGRDRVGEEGDMAQKKRGSKNWGGDKVRGGRAHLIMILWVGTEYVVNII